MQKCFADVLSKYLHFKIIAAKHHQQNFVDSENFQIYSFAENVCTQIFLCYKIIQVRNFKGNFSAVRKYFYNKIKLNYSR